MKRFKINKINIFLTLVFIAPVFAVMSSGFFSAEDIHNQNNQNNQNNTLSQKTISASRLQDFNILNIKTARASTQSVSNPKPSLFDGIINKASDTLRNLKKDIGVIISYVSNAVNPKKEAEVQTSLPSNFENNNPQAPPAEEPESAPADNDIETDEPAVENDSSYHPEDESTEEESEPINSVSQESENGGSGPAAENQNLISLFARLQEKVNELQKEMQNKEPTIAKGDKGDKGDKGEQGLQGHQGPAGPQGSAGAGNVTVVPSSPVNTNTWSGANVFSGFGSFESLGVAYDLSAGRSFGVGGSATLGNDSSDTLTVNAASAFNNSITLSNAAAFTTGTGQVTFGGNVDVTGDLTITGTQTYSGAASFTADSASAALSVRQNGAGNIVDFKDGANSVFTIADGGDLAINTNQLYVDASAGNVGIGTTAPSEKLSVSGDIGITNGSLWQPVYGTDDGLILYWPFSETTGTTVYDHSSSGNDGTLGNATWTNGKYGSGVNFDKTLSAYAASSAVLTPDNLTSLSVEFWIKTSTITSNSIGLLVGKGGFGGWSNGFRILRDTSTGTLSWEIYSDTGSTGLYSSETVHDGNWHHLSFVLDGTTMVIYKDGAVIGNGNFTGSINGNWGIFVAGRNAADSTFSMDELKIYKRALSSDEVRTQYLRGPQTNVATVVGTSANANNTYGTRSMVKNLGIVTTGTDTTYGSYINTTRTGAIGGTINTYGQYVTVAGDTGGTSTAVGGYFSATGATNNYGLLVANGLVGIGTTSPASRIHGVTTLSAATGNEIAYQLNYTTNKATSGNDTGLLISMTDTLSPGTSYLIDAQVGGASKFSVSNTGIISGIADPLTQYALLAGRTGGQTIIGDTAASGNLTLQSTAHATKGKILFGTSAYDEVNNRLGIGTTAPDMPLSVVADGTGNVMKLINAITPGTEYIQVQAGGVQKGFLGAGALPFVISNSGALALQPTTGNVGIGTTTPLSLLTIGSGTPTTAANGLNFGADTLANLYRSAAATIKTDGSLIVAGSITATGNLLPSADNTYDLGSASLRWKTLHVGPGSVVIHNDATDTLKATLGFSGSTAQLATDAATAFQLATGANVGLNIDTSGNIGIGTTAPGRRLDVLYADSVAQLRLSQTGSVYSEFKVDSAGDLRISATGGDIRVLDENLWVCSGAACPSGNPSTTGNLIIEGNVGIGITNPTAKLEIGGTAGTDGIKFPDATMQTSAANATTYANSDGRAGDYYCKKKEVSASGQISDWTNINTSQICGFNKCCENGLCVVTDFICGTSQVLDADSNTYNTVLINDQCWLASNLKVGTKLASGSTMPANNGIIEKWCYDNSDANCTTDGGLYYWDEAMQYSTTPGVQGICPTGWHIPTDAQQYALENYLKDTGQTCDANRNGLWDCSTAGTKLKVGGTSGFGGILAGDRNTNGSFNNRGTDANFWSSTESGANAWDRYLYSGYATVGRNASNKAYGFSVRCLKD